MLAVDKFRVKIHRPVRYVSLAIHPVKIHHQSTNSGFHFYHVQFSFARRLLPFVAFVPSAFSSPCYIPALIASNITNTEISPIRMLGFDAISFPEAGILLVSTKNRDL